MKTPIMKNPPFFNIMSSFITLPTPSNISTWWNFGSMLGLCLITQIISGLILTMHYLPSTSMAFYSVIHIMNDTNMGWMIRYLHLNMASFFFICLYIHMLRGLYNMSFTLKYPWLSGISILFILMATAFMGYVLPWGQMSFWGATVITNLMSAIPYVGNLIVTWLWGGFSVSHPTLNRFYTFHFILPFIVLMMVIIHLTMLHETGSNNPLGVQSNFYKISFHPYFTLKDMMGFLIMFMLIMTMINLSPNFLNDPENFIEANPMSTPPHIQPEWYFLFAYSILRSIPNKLGGVIALIMSILILMLLPLMNKYTKIINMKYSIYKKMIFIMLIHTIIILTWIGMKPIESPFLQIGQIYSTMYFTIFLLLMKNSK
uniref:Cytochrome b n=1 Tax=Ceraphronidae sp. ZJUH_2016007 TaxID=2491153 RepID=A0A3Q8U9X2_9HYME|nr:cytochrome b [Ceraphronidae sp. ZJUH_2016007]